VVQAILACIQAGLNKSDIITMFDTADDGSVGPAEFDAGLRRISTRLFDFSADELDQVKPLWKKETNPVVPHSFPPPSTHAHHHVRVAHVPTSPFI
jgi:hypothetical protein